MEFYRALNRAVEWLNGRSRRLVLTPYARAIGDCATDVYYGLLKARREGKRVLFACPATPFPGFPFRVANAELFELQSEVPPASPSARRVVGWMLTLLFGLLRCWYPVRRRLSRLLTGRTYVNPFYVVPSIGRATLWKPDHATTFSWEEVQKLDWQGQFNRPIGVRLTPDRLREGERVRAQLGIPPQSWFACLHVREGGFRNDWSLEAFRNADVRSYLGAIAAITSRGGYVVRLGDATMSALPALDGVIDYAHSPFKSELMDLYLISQCRFFVGTVSGPIEVAWLFERPVLATNQIDWISYFPHRRGDRAILKHAFLRAERRFLTLREVLRHPEFSLYGLGEAYQQAFEMFENSPEELETAVIEFINGLDSDQALSPLQDEFNVLRRAEVRRWLGTAPRLFASELDDLAQRYRLASAYFFAGALSQSFLADNWSFNSREPRRHRMPAAGPQ